ncbi:cytochrome c [Elioraea sp.]|uniref:c-type cytochrome n=1 Tax=Elioraea sp. TaxID=2185103 RepID=UPI00307D23AF
MNRALLAAALAAAVAAPVAALASAAIIQERQAGFKMMGDSMRAIQAVVQAGGPASAAVEPARAIAEHAPKIKTLFPAGSDQGARTRALPTIWSDRAGFEGRADAFTAQVQALLAAARGGDLGALRSALEATGQACGNCHRPYRAPER